METMTLTAKVFGQEISITANWCDGNFQIIGDERGRTVADFSYHPRMAIRAVIEDFIRNSGDDPDEHREYIKVAVTKAMWSNK